MTISWTCGGSNCLYAINIYQEKENSADVVIGLIKFFTFDVYALIDLGASLYFVTPYIAMNFNILHDHFLKPFIISKLVGDSILTERV